MYQTKNFENLKGLNGFSDKALEIHLKLYAGYVDNTNKLIEKLKITEIGTPESAELKRRFGWEFNGMRLHEIYFSSLSKEISDIDRGSEIFSQIEKNFGSFENWQKDFTATALSRGIGWTILYWDKSAEKLLNVWIEQHHSGHLAGAIPLLPLDMFEHAFMIDYETDKKSYVKAFMNAVDWKKINERFQQ